MAARKGATLVEVLVSIFLMGIGLMSLMVLFPLGALTMAEAVQNDRATQAASSGAALAKIDSLRTTVSGYDGDGNTDVPPTGGRSYPVYVDPVGYYTFTSTAKTRMGATNIPRVSTTGITTQTMALRRLSLWDDWNFDTNGQALLVGGSPERDGRYTWAYMTQRTKYADTTDLSAELAVVVYYQRNLTTNLGTSAPYEKTYSATFSMGQTSVTLVPTGTNDWPPPVRKGTWLLDGSDTPAKVYQREFLFYRVQEVKSSDATSMVVEIQNKARGNGTVCVVMEDVIEVFLRGKHN